MASRVTRPAITVRGCAGVRPGRASGNGLRSLRMGQITEQITLANGQFNP